MVGDCQLSPEEYVDVIAQGLPVRKMGIEQDNMISSPWRSVVSDGTFKRGQGDTVEIIVTNRASPGGSLVAPEFKKISELCGTSGGDAKVGQTIFSASLDGFRERGPLVCLSVAFTAVEDSLRRAEQSVRELVNTYINNDIRNQLLIHSGVKITLNKSAWQTSGWDGLVSGGVNQVSVDFPGTIPDGEISMKVLIKLAQFMREQLRLKPFPGGSQGYFILNGSTEAIEKLRSQIEESIIATVQGGYASGYGLEAGLDQLKAYAFTDVMHRGWIFGVEQEPMRVKSIDNNGQPVLAEPGITVDADVGTDYVANPEFVNAPYEILFAVAPESFRRLVPEAYTGEGSWRWASQPVLGELDFRMPESEECNAWKEFGRHYFQIQRAFVPERPHAVIPILCKRCEPDDLFDSCGGATTSDAELLGA